MTQDDGRLGDFLDDLLSSRATRESQERQVFEDARKFVHSLALPAGKKFAQTVESRGFKVTIGLQEGAWVTDSRYRRYPRVHFSFDHPAIKLPFISIVTGMSVSTGHGVRLYASMRPSSQSMTDRAGGSDLSGMTVHDVYELIVNQFMGLKPL